MGVTPQQILQAREYRAGLQQEFIHTYGLPLVCFTMNIAGPKKDSPLVRRAFHFGCQTLLAAFHEHHVEVAGQQTRLKHTGCEAYYAVRANAHMIKKLCTESKILPHLAGYLIWTCWTKREHSCAGRKWVDMLGAASSAEHPAPLRFPKIGTPWSSCGSYNGNFMPSFSAGRSASNLNAGSAKPARRGMCHTQTRARRSCEQWKPQRHGHLHVYR